MKNKLLASAFLLFSLLLINDTPADDDNQANEGYLATVIEHAKKAGASGIRTSIMEILKAINFAEFKKKCITEINSMDKAEYTRQYSDLYARVISKTPLLVQQYKFKPNSSREFSTNFVSSLTLQTSEAILNDIPDEVLLQEGLNAIKMLKSIMQQKK